MTTLTKERAQQIADTYLRAGALFKKMDGEHFLFVPADAPRSRTYAVVTQMDETSAVFQYLTATVFADL